MNFYKHHLGDYDGATTHLTWDEDLAYRRLLGVYYRSEEAIPASQAHRLVRATTGKQKAAVDVVLMEFFERDGEVWRNKRADREIAAYQHQVSVNRRIGKLGGRPNRTETESVTEPEPNRNPNQEPEAINQKPRAIARERATPLPPDFKISERVKTWADSKGLTALEEDLEFFVGRMRANGKKYIDWDEAFMNCVREDWAGLRKAKQ